MFKGIVFPGEKFEIGPLKFNENEKKIMYDSEIYDTIDSNKIKAAVPIKKGALVSLDINSKYELYIHAPGGLYRCRAVLTELYKEGNLYVMILEIYTTLQEYQRREYYRLTCNIDLKYKLLTKEETDMIMQFKELASYTNDLQTVGLIKGITLDISGGGMRFVSASDANEGDYILAEFNVEVGGKPVKYRLLSTVVMTRELPNRKHIYEHRVKFEKISAKDREQLIKFIFEEERRLRKREKG